MAMLAKGQVRAVPGDDMPAQRVPLRWLTAGERPPALLRSGSEAEDLLYKGSLRWHVIPGHGTHLSLGQPAIASMPASVRFAVQKP